MMSYIFALIIMFALALLATCVLFITHLEDKFDLKYIRNKIKDFFYKIEKENGKMYYNPYKPQSPPEPPSKSDNPENEDLRAFKEELNSLDAKIEYAEQLKELEKQKQDKELYLERLYADEDEFEILYILIHTEPSIWNPVSEYGSKWVKGVYQTRNEANLAIEGDYSNYQIVTFNYLPTKEEEEDD